MNTLNNTASYPQYQCFHQPVESLSTVRKSKGVSASKTLITLLVITMFAGSFSLDRIIPNLELPLLLNEVRYLLFFILLLLVLARSSINKTFAFPNQAVFTQWILISLLLFSYFGLSVLWAPSTSKALEYLSNVLMIPIIMLFVPIIFGTNVEGGFKFSMLLILLISLIYMIAGSPESTTGRLAALGGGSNVFARVVGMGALGAIYLWAKHGAFFWLMPVIPLTGVLILSGSRGGLLGFIIASFLLGVVIMRQKRRSYIQFSICTATLLAIFWSIPSISAPIQNYWRIRFYEQTFIDRHSSARDLLFEEAWQMFLDHPGIGVGLTGFSILSKMGLPYPHNLILELASEGGIIALSLFSILLILVVKRWFQNKTIEHKVALIFAIQYFVCSMFSGGLYDTRFMWLFLTIFMLPAYEYSHLYSFVPNTNGSLQQSK